jgi:RHS repeat-associated protein
VPTYGYTGREPDASGLVYYRARYYDPSVGRFTQRDPVGYLDGLNRYAYVGNNPINFTDPHGLTAQGPLGIQFASQNGSYFGPSSGSFFTGESYQVADASGVIGGSPTSCGQRLCNQIGTGPGPLEILDIGTNLVAPEAKLGVGIAGAIVKGVTKGASEASSLANAARLRGQLAGQEIASGHAFEKHVIQQSEFKNLGIRTREQFANHIENVINNPTATRQLSGGRTAYWDDATGTVVIRNPRATDGGTAFRPTLGRKYFDEILH